MASSSKKILVSGGSGFIGSHFIRHLYTKYPDYEIYNLDLLTYAGNPDNLLDIVTADGEKKVHERKYHFINGDICDIPLINRLYRNIKPDVVVNFAAESHVDRSIFDSRYFFKTNLIGVHNLVDLHIKHNLKRFIQISTDEVYGEVLRGTSTEDAKFQPSNPYSASKASADLLVQSYIRTHNFPALILRGSNNFGPNQYPEKLIPLAVTNIIENKKVPIHGTGLQRRRWLHVDDFCSAIDLAMHESKNFGIYNVAGVELTNLDIINILCKKLNVNPKKVIKFINDRPGGDMRYAPNASKIKKELGWKTHYSTVKNIADVAQWYVEHTDWWKKIKKRKEFSIRYNKQYKSEY